MNYNEYSSELLQAFEQNGLSHLINEDAAQKLYAFSDILIQTNKSFNLTAITDEKEIILKHFVDCASVCEYIPRDAKLIDVGCGAGFPSIPIAILRPDVSVTPLDSTGKKVDFINMTAKKLGLSNVSAVCARAEEFAAAHREQFDVCISRAVARLNILDELCVPFARKGGNFIAMKSSKGEEEYTEACSGLEKLGCVLKENVKKSFFYNEMTIERNIYVFKKISATPTQFPRKYAQILKKPL
jgi:16S rRNA (guanine527-N7)-methyltransferase